MSVLLIVAVAIVLSLVLLCLLRYIVVSAADIKLAARIAPYLKEANAMWRSASPAARYRMLIDSRIAANYAATLTLVDWDDLPINVRTWFTEVHTRMTKELLLTHRMRSHLVLCQLKRNQKIHPTDRMYVAPRSVNSERAGD